MAIAFDKEFKTEVNGTVATVTYEDDNAFFENTDITKKQFKDVFDHTEAYVEAAAKAGAAEAKSVFKDNGDVETVKVKFPYTPSKRGHVLLNVEKAVTKTNNFTKETTTSPYIKVEVKDPFSRMTRDRVKELEVDLANAIA